jgi:hypothetical protein
VIGEMRKRLPRSSLHYVKTTIDLPRSLLKQIKHHAVENEMTLKALIISALKKQLGLR